MADNIAVTPGSGATVGTDDVGGVQIQRVKLTWGPDGTANDADVATGKPVPVQMRSSTGTEIVFNANGQAAMTASAPVTIANNQSYPTGMAPKGFAVDFTTLTRPANTTAYTAADSVSNNPTAGSVTVLSATISDTNDDLVTLTEVRVRSTDTGLAGKKLRAYLFNTDYTASSGVVGGDNAAFSMKIAGYVASFEGLMETGFSDGTVGRLIPTFNDASNTPAGAFVIAKPSTGGKLLYIAYQAVEAFTPSANSTTIIGTAVGFQARAA